MQEKLKFISQYLSSFLSYAQISWLYIEGIFRLPVAIFRLMVAPYASP
jgi:hypothetical protein